VHEALADVFALRGEPVLNHPGDDAPRRADPALACLVAGLIDPAAGIRDVDDAAAAAGEALEVVGVDLRERGLTVGGVDDGREAERARVPFAGELVRHHARRGRAAGVHLVIGAGPELRLEAAFGLVEPALVGLRKAAVALSGRDLLRGLACGEKEAST